VAVALLLFGGGKAHKSEACTVTLPRQGKRALAAPKGASGGVVLGSRRQKAQPKQRPAPAGGNSKNGGAAKHGDRAQPCFAHAQLRLGSGRGRSEMQIRATGEKRRVGNGLTLHVALMSALDRLFSALGGG